MRTIDAVEQYHDRHIGEAGDTIRHEQADIRARAQRRAFHCHEAQAGWVDAGIRKIDGAKVGHGIVNTPLPLRTLSLLSNAVAASSGLYWCEVDAAISISPIYTPSNTTRNTTTATHPPYTHGR